MIDSDLATELMNAPDDVLLRQFATHADEQAFHALVRRYAGMVFAVALRRCERHHLAEEAVQNVFTILAGKATALKSRTALGGWLHRTALFESAKVIRRETRRSRAHEQYSANMEINQARHASDQLATKVGGSPGFIRSFSGLMLPRSESSMENQRLKNLTQIQHIPEIEDSSGPESLDVRAWVSRIRTSFPPGLAPSPPMRMHG